MSFETQISNFYEKLVVDELEAREDTNTLTEDLLVDIACVALNQLPARYYRFSVDMAFYLPSSEFEDMKTQVQEAVSYAISFVRKHKNRADSA